MAGNCVHPPLQQWLTGTVTDNLGLIMRLTKNQNGLPLHMQLPKTLKSWKILFFTNGNVQQ
jgi:hypothetical protein